MRQPRGQRPQGRQGTRAGRWELGEPGSRERTGITQCRRLCSDSEGGRACDRRLTALPAPRYIPRPRASPFGPPGRCPGLGSCSLAGAGTTAPRSPPLCWPTDCASPGPRAPAARWGVRWDSAGVPAGGGRAFRGRSSTKEATLQGAQSLKYPRAVPGVGAGGSPKGERLLSWLGAQS